MSMPEYTGEPVAVIGNGPVGQTTALLLAHWGIPSVLLDARPARDDVGSKAICQQRDVLDVWSAVGAGQIAEEGLTWDTARTFYRDKEIFAWSFTDRGRSPLPPFVNLSQSRTEAILDEQIRRAPLIDVRWGYEVTGMCQTRRGVEITCETTDGAVRLSTVYVVAAAGAHGGRIRKLIGVSFDGQTFDDRFLICDLRADVPAWENERRFYFDPAWNPGRQVLIHPCPDSRFRIDWQVPAEFDLESEAASGGLDNRMRQIIGDRPYEVLWQTVYRFHSRLVDRMRVGRVLLAGDIAHLLAPFGARGLNSGVGDAENAAWKLAFVLHGWADEELLESYQTERHAAALENLNVIGDTMRFLVPQDARERAARVAVLERALTDPAAHGEVDSGRFAEPFWYTDSPLTTPAYGRTFAGRPPRGQMPEVVPGVLLPDLPVCVVGRPDIERLRQLVRHGFLLLLTEGVSATDVARQLGAVTDAPWQIHRIADLDDRGGLAEALNAKAGEIWVVRPDGHVAAVVPADTPDALSAAVRRAVGAQRPHHVPAHALSGSEA